MAQTRDRFLYELHHLLAEIKDEEIIQSPVIFRRLPESYSSVYSESSLKTMAKHLISAWSEAGFFSKGSRETRVLLNAEPENIAFAFYACFLLNVSGEHAFRSPWISNLFLPKIKILELGMTANRLGYMDFLILRIFYILIFRIR